MSWQSIKLFLFGLIKAIGEYYGYANNKQLLDAGEAKAELDVLKNSNAAEEIAKQTVIDVNSLNSDQLANRMREWFKKPK